MDNTNLWIFLAIIAFIVFVVMILAIAIGYFWASSKTKTALLKQNDVIFKQAQEQLQSWKDQDLISIKQQIYDAAKGQTIQEMQEQVQKWQQNELQQAKQNMFDAAKGQVTQEMQEQMRKWQEGELQHAKQQIFDAVKGQSTQEIQEQIRKNKCENGKKVNFKKYASNY